MYWISITTPRLWALSDGWICTSPRSITSRGPSDHCRAPVPMMVASEIEWFYNTITRIFLYSLALCVAIWRNADVTSVRTRECDSILNIMMPCKYPLSSNTIDRIPLLADRSCCHLTDSTLESIILNMLMPGNYLVSGKMHSSTFSPSVSLSCL